ncbi:hypothetical protein ACZ91_60415 [Streptomyces regensis]|nr:hypothetical protein ACZ91_60415 [Streptomyces regensis]
MRVGITINRVDSAASNPARVVSQARVEMFVLGQETGPERRMHGDSGPIAGFLHFGPVRRAYTPTGHRDGR